MIQSDSWFPLMYIYVIQLEEQYLFAFNHDTQCFHGIISFLFFSGYMKPPKIQRVVKLEAMEA